MCGTWIDISGLLNDIDPTISRGLDPERIDVPSSLRQRIAIDGAVRFSARNSGCAMMLNCLRDHADAAFMAHLAMCSSSRACVYNAKQLQLARSALHRTGAHTTEPAAPGPHSLEEQY
jgi:hypothetical protein